MFYVYRRLLISLLAIGALLAGILLVSPTSASAAPSWNCTTPAISKTLESDSSGGWWRVDVSMKCTGSSGARTYSVYAYRRPSGAEIFHNDKLTNDQSYSTSFTVPAEPLGSTQSACVTASNRVDVPIAAGSSNSKNLCWNLSWGSGLQSPTRAFDSRDAAAGTSAEGASPMPASPARAAEPPFCQTLGSSWATSTQGRSGTITVKGRCEVSKSNYEADVYVNGEFWARSSGTVSGVGSGEHNIKVNVPSMPKPNDRRGNYTWVLVKYSSGASFKIEWEEELGYLPCTGC